MFAISSGRHHHACPFVLFRRLAITLHRITIDGEKTWSVFHPLVFGGLKCLCLNPVVYWTLLKNVEKFISDDSTNEKTQRRELLNQEHRNFDLSTCITRLEARCLDLQIIFRLWLNRKFAVCINVALCTCSTDPAFPAITSAAAKSHTRGSGTVDKGVSGGQRSKPLGVLGFYQTRSALIWSICR